MLLPVMSLVRPGELLLIAGEHGAPCCAAAARVAAASSVPLRAIRIGHVEGDYRDPRRAWLRQREIGADGAILVRPDRYVAWRSAGAAADPARELRSALGTILGREVR